MNELIKKWFEFKEYAENHNKAQFGYPSLYKNGIDITFERFMEWLVNNY